MTERSLESICNVARGNLFGGSVSDAFLGGVKVFLKNLFVVVEVFVAGCASGVTGTAHQQC